jgi:hypothetical protein
VKIRASTAMSIAVLKFFNDFHWAFLEILLSMCESEDRTIKDDHILTLESANMFSSVTNCRNKFYYMGIMVANRITIADQLTLK